jgi:methionine-rich copper-binding protein CopC
MFKPASKLPRCLAVAALLLIGSPAVARAHAILVESQPMVGGAVVAGHVAIRLRYNSRIDHARSRLTLNNPDKSQTVLATPATDAVDILSAATDLAPGAYTLRWQVLAVDGHITRGDVPFTVTAPGSSSGGISPQTGTAAAAAH